MKFKYFSLNIQKENLFIKNNSPFPCDKIQKICLNAFAKDSQTLIHFIAHTLYSRLIYV